MSEFPFIFSMQFRFAPIYPDIIFFIVQDETEILRRSSHFKESFKKGHENILLILSIIYYL